MFDLAKSRGGRCLSTEYNGTNVKLKWQCGAGHIFDARPHRVKNEGTWCPTCNGGISERICRAIFEQAFDCSFSKLRPKWLQSSSGRYLELDGYNASLNIAFEYNGEMHYQDIPYFMNATRHHNDAKKAELCKANGTKLFIIPYPLSNVRFPEYVRSLIIKQATFFGVKLTDGFDKATINIDKCYMQTKENQELDKLREIAIQRGGKCLAQTYLGSKKPLPFVCKEGHKWMAAPSNIKDGTWCKICSIRESNIKKRTSAEVYKKIAEERGGKFMSVKVGPSDQKHEWECEAGHRFFMTPHNVKICGHWCPKCGHAKRAADSKISVAVYEAIATKHGGELLSMPKGNSHCNAKWKCAVGHVFFMSLRSARSRQNWCPKCPQKRAKKAK